MISIEKSILLSLFDLPVEAMAIDAGALEMYADKALRLKPLSVTDKDNPVSSANDYISIKKYWWPNPETVNGMPYVLIDGKVNTECYSDTYDNLRFVELSENISALAAAVYLKVGNVEAYAKHAELLLETWFVNDNTRQNPNFEFAQMIPGTSEGSFSGIIEARFLIYIIRSVQYLEDYDGFSKEVLLGFRQWLADFKIWLLTSKHGVQAKKAKNNIGFWYDLISISVADYLGETQMAVDILTGDSFNRLVDNTKPDGSLPNEMSRANPNNYISFCMLALSQIANFGEKYGVSLWDSKSSDGRAFQAVEDWFSTLSQVKSVSSLCKKVSVAVSRKENIFDENLINLAAYQRVIDRQRNYIIELSGELKRIAESTNSQEKNSLSLSDLEKSYKDLSEEMEIVKITYSKRADYYKEMYLKQRKLLRDLDQFDI